MQVSYPIQPNLVDVMDNYVYSALCRYFNTLEQTGYISFKKQSSLLILVFYYHLLFDDYRGYVNREDYRIIGQALNCLFGTNCLIPYPDYLKMGKLKLGVMTEVLDRLKATERYNKELDARILDNDALIADNTRRIDTQGTDIDAMKDYTNGLVRRILDNDVLIADNTRRIDEYGSRISSVENNIGNPEPGNNEPDGHEELLEDHNSQLHAHSDRLAALEQSRVITGRNYIQEIPDLDLSTFDTIQD